MARILEIATSVSTPLALGGLIAGILFLVIRQIIAKDIFGRLAGPATKEVIVKIIDKLFYLALVAIILGFIGYLVPKLVTARVPEISPEYVEVGLDEDRPLEKVVQVVAQTRNVTIVFWDNCGQNVRGAIIERGNHSGNNIKEFLENLRQRVKTTGVSYVVRQEGARRYEIACD